MPLIKGKTEESMSKNIERLRHEGKPENQAVAIAYSVKREAEHKQNQYKNHSVVEDYVDMSSHHFMKKNHFDYK